MKYRRSIAVATIVRNWFIVSVMEKEHRIGYVIYGIVEEDERFRFTKGDYVSTSRILNIEPKKGLITTVSGNLYQLSGRGRKEVISSENFELMRNGLSPDQIRMLTNGN